MGTHTVQEYMTVSPVVIASDRPLSEAHRLMRERGFRHLPVVDGGRLVGLVSQRDLYLMETLAGVDPATETVREAMSDEPYTVAPDARLEDVAARMAERKLGSALVVDRGSVIGVFTTVDALRALAQIASRRRSKARAAGRARPGGAR
jgi:acetoin utilization protein AcuB